MTLIDTSAWVEFLRNTNSDVADAVDRLLDTSIATTDVVTMEVLAGARDEQHLDQLRGLLARATLLPTNPVDYEVAATLYRSCRRSGERVRRLTDYMIAAVAIRNDVEVLHADSDFEVIARHTPLRSYRPT